MHVDFSFYSYFFSIFISLIKQMLIKYAIVGFFL